MAKRKADPRGKPRRVLWMLAVVGAVVLAVLAGRFWVQRTRSSSPSTSSATSRYPNIIFLTVDTLRADHLPLYGYDRPTAPKISDFGRHAVTFDTAIVPRGSTRQSYASMLTGLYPYKHGVRSNGTVLHDQLVTLPEMLKQAGYTTAAFVSSFVMLGEQSGFAQGFDLYDDQIWERELSRPNFERTAKHTLKRILDWLAQGPPEPFFLFTHFIDPHGPYTPPPEFRRLFRSERHKSLEAGLIPPYQRIGQVTDYYEYLDRYDAEIRYVDWAMGRILETLKAKGLFKDALIVFVADHGEAMGEHGIYFDHHLHVYECTTRVPMIIKPPGQDDQAPGRRVAQVVSPMDLAPTVLAMLHRTVPVAFDGRDLLAAMAGREDPDRTMLVEFPATEGLGRIPYDIYALRTTTRKVIHYYDAQSGKLVGRNLFDMVADPLERNDLVRTERAPKSALDKMLLAQARQAHNYELPFTVTIYEMPLAERPAYIEKRLKHAVVKQHSPEALQQLRSLGYVR